MMRNVKSLWKLAIACIAIIGCSKDNSRLEVKTEEVKTDKVFNIDDDIRVLKVQSIGSNYGFYDNEVFTIYDYEEGKLRKLTSTSPTQPDYVHVSADFDYKDLSIEIKAKPSNVNDGWEQINIDFNEQNQVTDISVWTPVIPHFIQFMEQSDLHVQRNSNGVLKNVLLNEETFYGPTYEPVSMNIISNNSFGLPEKAKAERYKKGDWMRGTVFYTTAFDFEFKYNQAKDVPSQLKRLINEELLYLNRYGVSNYDLFKLAPESAIFKFVGSGYPGPIGYLGLGNWAVSFGLPQYYILENKSEYMVSQRTTHIYKLDFVTREEEYVKTVTEDFPYIHDAKARTLEIAGMKIWYEYVDKGESL